MKPKTRNVDFRVRVLKGSLFGPRRDGQVERKGGQRGEQKWRRSGGKRRKAKRGKSLGHGGGAGRKQRRGARAPKQELRWKTFTMRSAKDGENMGGKGRPGRQSDKKRGERKTASLSEQPCTEGKHQRPKGDIKKKGRRQDSLSI